MSALGGTGHASHNGPHIDFIALKGFGILAQANTHLLTSQLLSSLTA
jgi:hypothetical protein